MALSSFTKKALKKLSASAVCVEINEILTKSNVSIRRNNKGFHVFILIVLLWSHEHLMFKLSITLFG